MDVLFCHGLEGSPEGTKVRAMRAAGISVDAPDFRGKVLGERIAQLAARLDALDPARPLLLAGSSYGGAVAAWTAMQRPGRFHGLLLLAPALHHAEPPVPSHAAYRPVPIPTIILHGTRDTVVPLSASEAYAARAPAGVDLRRVDDDHRLAASLPLIVAAIAELQS